MSWAHSRPYSLRVCNNVTVQFQAMLYCRDSYTTPDFWHRVQQCSNRQGKKTAEAIGDLFIATQKAYVQGGGRCLNGAVRAADEWIAFLESAPPGPGPSLQAPSQTQREIRYGNWIRRKERDVLQDAGRPFPQQSEAMKIAPLPQVPSGPEARHQYPSAPSEWRGHPNYDHIPVIKRESAHSSPESPDEIANRPNNVSSIDLGPPRPAIFTPRPSKRKRAESPDSRSVKHRTNGLTRDGSLPPLIKREPRLPSPEILSGNEDFPCDVSIIDLYTPGPGVFTPPRPSKMQRAETAGLISMKRRANALTRDASLAPIVLGSKRPSCRRG
jgi:hypothetical protein